MIVTRGELYDSSVLPGFIALRDGAVAGAVLYRPGVRDFEIAVLYALQSGQGIGTALLDRAVEAARELDSHRVWLATTNDNTQAIRYYQKYGFSLKAVHIGALDETRKLKPGIPLTGIDGIPIKHEFEFELNL